MTSVVRQRSTLASDHTRELASLALAQQAHSASRQSRPRSRSQDCRSVRHPHPPAKHMGELPVFTRFPPSPPQQATPRPKARNNHAATRRFQIRNAKHRESRSVQHTQKAPTRSPAPRPASRPGQPSQPNKPRQPRDLPPPRNRQTEPAENGLKTGRPRNSINQALLFPARGVCSHTSRAFFVPTAPRPAPANQSPVPPTAPKKTAPAANRGCCEIQISRVSKKLGPAIRCPQGTTDYGQPARNA